MLRLSNFQVYCMLLLFCAPIAFLQVGKYAIDLLLNNAYLAVVATIIPGILIIYIFHYIIQKSTFPFPFMLEEHLGPKAGKIIGFLYSLIFLFFTSFSLRLFIDFIETNVLPQTPITIFLGLLLLCSCLAVKTGLGNFARMCEVIVILGLSFAFTIAFLSFFQHPDIKNLLPFAYINSLESFFRAVFMLTSEILKLTAILFLAFFIPDKKASFSIMIKVLFTFITLISSITIATIMVLGAHAAKLFTFPTFIVVRIINIADFITNLDAIFIGLWVIGIFGSSTLFLFLFCITTSFVFNLQEYRFLASPSSLIIAVLALQMASNILELNIIIVHIAPVLLFIFFFLIPLLLFFITWKKPYPSSSSPLEIKDHFPTYLN
ncbi:spore germination protein (amino acid permease) [Thermosyntropha lipolytica DSM 11003]|uniref:Spore germination protein (Amino acid permease) n=1 Tax=Thermosyntropha lipolytica DSM 11003 TaxID=1123382 RepID=A0A1M5JSV9_9FIRM|nr:GerAB/ArcD/ProY family transporter [Thermosyntropha lipolytica]SHG43359.1 spore germination protein (amino acid permease) [Thermosyntropha lipolytica DSM 11003]